MHVFSHISEVFVVFHMLAKFADCCVVPLCNSTGDVHISGRLCSMTEKNLLFRIS